MERYDESVWAALPPGRIWRQLRESNLYQLIVSICRPLFDLRQRVDDLMIREIDPRSTVELLPEFERMLGLPDPCAPAAQTLQERRARVIQKLTLQPGPQLQYLQFLASTLGYTNVSITETGPYELTCEVPEPRLTRFRCGSSRCGDLLGKIDRASDLECLLNEEKPAHLALIFNYSGV